MWKNFMRDMSVLLCDFQKNSVIIADSAIFGEYPGW
jgi:hypothetical protein